jgi:hypothetical protein
MTNRDGGTGWGNGPSGAPFPLADGHPGAVHRGRVLGRQSASTPDVVDRRRVAALARRGVFCCEQPAAAGEEDVWRQPGVSDPGSAAPNFALGVAPGRSLTPGCVSRSSDTCDRAVIVDMPRCLVVRRVARSPRTVPREGVEITIFFPTGGCYSTDQAAHARQTARETPHATGSQEQRDVDLTRFGGRFSYAA